MLNNFQKYVRNFIVQVGKHEISPNRLEIVHNDYYDFRSMYGKILFSAYREHTIGDIVNEFGVPRECVSVFQKNRYCIDCEAYVRGEKMLEERMNNLEEKFDKNEKMLQSIYEKISDLKVETEDFIEDDYEIEPMVLKYTPEGLINAILDIGSSMYSLDESVDFLIELIRLGLGKEYYPIIREENRVLCLAFNYYDPELRDEIPKKLKVIPSLFSPVICGPESTILIIDCEKQHLRKKAYKIGISDWIMK